MAGRERSELPQLAGDLGRLDAPLAHDLFLLMLNLSQLRESERMRCVFIEAVNRMIPGVTLTPIELEQASDACTDLIHVATSHQRYACFAIRAQSPGCLSPANRSLLRNAGRMLALLLEKREQEQQLERERAALKQAVREQTAQLSQSEQALQSIFRTAPSGITMVRERKIQWTNPAFERMFGYTQDELRGLDSRVFYANDQEYQRLSTEYIDELARLGVCSTEVLLQRKNGQTFTALISSALLDSKDISQGVVSTITDLTDINQTRQALRRSQRELETNNRIAAVFLTAEDDDLFPQVLDVVLKATDSAYGLFGYIDDDQNLVCPSMTREIFEGCQVDGKSLRFPHEAWVGLWGRCLRERQTLWANDNLGFPPGHLKLASALTVPIVDHRDLFGLFILANRPGGYDQQVAREVERIAHYVGPLLSAHLRACKYEQQRRADEQYRTRLVSELDHRVKNNLANVIGLMEQTRGACDSIETFHHKLLGRIRAMAATHETLAKRRWENFELADVAKRIVAAFDATGGQLVLPEKPLVLPARYAQPLGLVLHELATNAVQFGSLSVPGGRVTLTWQKPDETRLSIRWCETGGPTPETPQHAGVGARLIEGLVDYQMQGKVIYEYAPAGLICTIELPATTWPGV